MSPIRRGTIYGALMNFRSELEALSPTFLFPSLKEVDRVLDAIMN